ncbi:MAG TPA: hypothetical protein VGG74_37090 [Kofleriaceae bacterium]|jgi:hypothetical protein
MVDAWQILRDAGVPIVGPITGIRPAREDVVASTRVAVADATGRDADALAAWVLAWHAHWPRSFAASFPDDGDAIAGWATSCVTDANRYLKLRRIAIENLATIL